MLIFRRNVCECVRGDGGMDTFQKDALCTILLLHRFWQGRKEKKRGRKEGKEEEKEKKRKEKKEKTYGSLPLHWKVA